MANARDGLSPKAAEISANPVNLSDPLISLRDIQKSYRNNGTQINVLDHLSVDIFSGDTIAIVGESGIGKSTFLHVLGTLDQPDAGIFLYNQKDVFRFDKKKLANFRNATLGFVFQFHYLLPEFTAFENVVMPGLIQGLSKADMREPAESLLVRVGLKNRMRHRVRELSGGEQQRVALARALVMKPKLLLADEPTGNLDQKNSHQVHELLFELNNEHHMTIITVTHNMKLAGYMKRQMTLVEGKLVEIA
ncbi:MAG: ABC transporter ATP-binding protein [Desulfobacteraceae bacterium]|nr:MAG: ABC transporter ATP-binding protein [Desulfobacteraceae bacterium]